MRCVRKPKSTPSCALHFALAFCVSRFALHFALAFCVSGFALCLRFAFCIWLCALQLCFAAGVILFYYSHH